MDKLPKRRVLSLSLSQHGKERKGNFSRRRRTSSKYSDASPAYEEPDVKELRNHSNTKSRDDASTVLIKSQCSKSLSSLTANDTILIGEENNMCVEDTQTVAIERAVPTDDATKYVGQIEDVFSESFNLSSLHKDNKTCKSSSSAERNKISTSSSQDQVDILKCGENSVSSIISKDDEIRALHLESSTEKISLKEKKLLDGKISSKETLQNELGTPSQIEPEIVHSANVTGLKETLSFSSSGNETGAIIHSLSEQQLILPCPVCLKTFDKNSTKAAHLKVCGVKHGMTTKQLVDAIDLQQRQAAERTAVGLPALISKTTKPKKSTSSGKDKPAVSRMDSGLQLAIALSLSLEENNRYCAAVQPPSLENFGFVSKAVLNSVRPHSIQATSKGKGKKILKQTPILQTRTDEERQRIITEKVAMVLMEEIDLTTKEAYCPVNLASELLQEYHNKERSLWSQTQLSPTKANRTSYYVKELQNFISPSIVETGSKIMHISQIAGRARTPEKVNNQRKESKCQDDSDSVVSVTPSDVDSSSDPDVFTRESSMNRSCISSQSVSKMEMELRAKLFNDWAGMVNNSSMSDLLIYPQEGRGVHTHKLLLAVRCPEILHDVVRQPDPLTDREIDIVAWPRIPHAAVLAFLEYLYCGSVKSIPALSDDLSSLKWLSSQYKVQDLKKYLRLISSASFARLPTSQAALIAIDETGTQPPPLSILPEQALGNSKSDSAAAVSDSRSSAHVKGRSILSERKIDCESEVSRILSGSLQSTPRVSTSDNGSIYSLKTLSEVGSQSRSESPDMFEDVLEDSVEKLTIMKRTCKELIKETINSLELPVSTLEEDASKRAHSPQRSRSTSLLHKSSESSARNSLPASPTYSKLSSATEILSPESGRSFPLTPSSISIDSKRKHSNSSSDVDRLSSKRLRRKFSWNDSEGNNSTPKSLAALSEFELCDLTQDSNAVGASPSLCPRLSGASCESVVISSDDETSNVNEIIAEKNIVPNEHNVSFIVSCDRTPQKQDVLEGRLPLEDKDNANNEQGVVITDEGSKPYISPVWDGFEDLNYDEPYLALSQRDREKVSENTVIETGSCPSACPNTQMGSRKQVSLLQMNDEESTLMRWKSTDLGSEPDSANQKSCDGQNTHEKQVLVVQDVQENLPSPLGALLDDSLNNALTSSILERAEKDFVSHSTFLIPNDEPRTPINRTFAQEVTPLANYSAMKTPDLKKEMRKFGLKPSLGKRKGKIMLRHIYNELHPWVPIEDNGSDEERTFLSQPMSNKDRQPLSLSQPSTPCKEKITSGRNSNIELEDGNHLSHSIRTEFDFDSDGSVSSSCSSGSSHEGHVFEGYENQLESLTQTSSQCAVGVNVWKDVQDFIVSDPTLHQKVLEYEPIWIEQLQTDLRGRGVKLKMADLMALLDEKCITFRTLQSGPRVKKRNKLKRNAMQSADDAICT